MACGFLLGYLVLLSYFLLHYSAANDHVKYPWPFQCAKLGLVMFPFTDIESEECGLPLSASNEPGEGEKPNEVHHAAMNKQLKPPPCTVVFLTTNSHHGPHHHKSPSLNAYSFFHNQSETQPNSTEQGTSLKYFVEFKVKLPDSSEKSYHGGGEWHPDQHGSYCPSDYGDKDTGPRPAPQGEKIEYKRRASKVVIIGLSIGLAITSTIALGAILLLYRRRHCSSDYQNKARSIYSNPNSNTIPQSGNVYFGIPVFSYEELQEATNNFDQARELGEGGFGTVYYGKLRDGREVAVKRLYERNYKPIESFINEIQILTRSHHRNLVSLYGCTSRHSRELLLVYEYVPNGTVSCHLHGDKSKSGLLPWPVRMRIAIETASALVYLHASDIIHRDVKTSNILLDNNFCVKVADFGLSRLFPDDVTHISTAPRGTPGYVDPDYRLCYQLTSKSDVYSFGVVLVELISSLPAVDMNRERDEVQLAKFALRKIQQGAFRELGDPNLGFQRDDKSRRMMISVAKLAFRCLQGDKDLRPSMSEVLEVLQRIESGKDEPGNLEGIEVHGDGVSLCNSHPLLPHTQINHKRLHQTL